MAVRAGTSSGPPAGRKRPNRRAPGSANAKRRDVELCDLAANDAAVTVLLKLPLARVVESEEAERLVIKAGIVGLHGASLPAASGLGDGIGVIAAGDPGGETVARLCNDEK